MATQDEPGVPFSISHDQQQFRLLELPPEILQLLESPNPPQLSIKSQAASAAPNSTAAYAVLCTPDKTFQLRQVQTSNSVFIAQPTLEAPQGDDIPRPSVSAIASCTATLELHAVGDSPLQSLKEALPSYDINDGTVDAAGNGKGKSRVFADIPASDGQCEAAWKELIAFEFAGSSYRPSANTLFQVWKSVYGAAAAEGVDIGKQFLTEEIINAVDDEGHPTGLVISLFRHLAADDPDVGGAWSCLERSKTVPFIGKIMLEAKRGEGDLLTHDFLEMWRDNLPEGWRKDAELGAIKEAYTFPTSTTIAWNGAAEGKGSAATDASVKGSSSRKWHAKFARARKK